MPENIRKQTPTDESARAVKISQLYPQPSTDKRSFTHFTSETPDAIVSENTSINWVKLIIAGLAIAVPFIIFEIGFSTLHSASSPIEVSQIRMLATLYLLFTASLAWFAYRYFSKISPVTNSSAGITYWMILLFSVPAMLLIKNLFTPSSPPFTAGMFAYYIAICVIYSAATIIIVYLLQRQNKGRSNNFRAVATFLALPYIVGLLIALLNTF